MNRTNTIKSPGKARRRKRGWLRSPISGARPAASLVVALLWIASAHAKTPVQRLTQYGHSAWRVQDGVMSAESVVAQTTDGYLWIGTTAGLLRFDGARFTPVNTFVNGSTADWKIVSMLATRDGSLWVGGGGFIAQLKQGVMTRHEVVGRVGSIVEDEAGTVWFAKTRVNGRGGPLCTVTGPTVRCFGKPDLPLVNAAIVSWSRNNGVRVANASTICNWSPAVPVQCIANKDLEPFVNLHGIAALLDRKDGSFWVGVGQTGPGLGLVKVDRGVWSSYQVPGFDGSKVPVESLLEDREGSLWVGTVDHGLYHINDGHVDHYASAEGLSSDTVSGGMFEDREGTIWVSTSGGLDAFRRLPVSVFSVREGLAADAVSAVLPARDGKVWLAGQELAMLRDDRPASVPEAIPFHGATPTSLFEDHSGRLWIGLNDTLNVFDGHTSKQITTTRNGPVGVVLSIVEDAAHDIWFLTAGEHSQLYRIHDGSAIEQPKDLATRTTSIAAAPSGGLWLGASDGGFSFRDAGAITRFGPDAVNRTSIVQMLVDDDGTVIGLASRGLVVQRGASRHVLDVEHGLPCAGNTALARDAQNGIWLLARCGLIQITDVDWRRWLAQPSGKVRYRLLDVTDGARPGAASFSPAGGVAPDGRLWFANESVAQVVDPAASAPAGAPLPVYIEEIVADRLVIDPAANTKLPQRTRDIEIRYTAPSFVAPQKIRFRYRLDGRDVSWRDAGNRRQAFYTDLPPGSYRFRVKASSGDGSWSAADAFVDFEIPNAWYQSRWFIALCLITGGAALYGLYLFRVRQVAATVRDRLTVKNAERIRIARDLHDTLLQSTQGLILRFQQAAQRIPYDEPARALMDKALERADETLIESRDRVKGLRGEGRVPVDLFAALAGTADELADIDGSCTPTIATIGAPRALAPIVAEEARLITREALVNAVTHARASRIEALVTFDDTHLKVSICDDGIGISDEVLRNGRADHWGLIGMRERADKIDARLDVRRRPSGGTLVELAIPAASAYATGKKSKLPWWRAPFMPRIGFLDDGDEPGRPS